MGERDGRLGAGEGGLEGGADAEAESGADARAAEGPATSRGRQPARPHIVGGTTGGGALSFDTQADRSKNRNSSAFCCGER